MKHLTKIIGVRTLLVLDVADVETKKNISCVYLYMFELSIEAFLLLFIKLYTQKNWKKMSKKKKRELINVRPDCMLIISHWKWQPAFSSGPYACEELLLSNYLKFSLFHFHHLFVAQIDVVSSLFFDFLIFLLPVRLPLIFGCCCAWWAKSFL